MAAGDSMSNEQAGGASAGKFNPVETRRGRSYFVFCAAIFLAAVIAGFGPTFFFRMWYHEQGLPLHLVLHGVVLTAWFLLFLTQTLLVLRNDRATHRRLGILGALLAPLVVLAALLAIFRIVENAANSGFDAVADRALIEFIIWSDLGVLVAFCAFIGFGFLMRHQSESHKRLMLFASLSLMAPAFIRVSSFPPFNALGGVLFVLVAFVLMTLSLVIYDLWATRRVHPATLIGVPFFFVVILGSAFLIPGSDLGRLTDPLFS